MTTPVQQTETSSKVSPLLGQLDTSAETIWKTLDTTILPKITIDSGPNIYYKCWEMRKKYDWHPDTYILCHRHKDGQPFIRPPTERVMRDIPKFWISKTRSQWNDIYNTHPWYETDAVRQIVGAGTEYAKFKIAIPGVYE